MQSWCFELMREAHGLLKTVLGGKLQGQETAADRTPQRGYNFNCSLNNNNIVGLRVILRRHLTLLNLYFFFVTV